MNNTNALILATHAKTYDKDCSPVLSQMNMIAFILSRIGQEKRIDFASSLPYASAFNELPAIFTSICAKAGNIAPSERHPGVTALVDLAWSATNLLMLLNLPVTQGDFGAVHSRMVYDHLFGLRKISSRKMLLAMLQEKSVGCSPRFWEKNCLICANCGQGEIEWPVPKEVKKGYKFSGCCQILVYCSSKCAAEHWKSHKLVCWSRQANKEKAL